MNRDLTCLTLMNTKKPYILSLPTKDATDISCMLVWQPPNKRTELSLIKLAVCQRRHLLCSVCSVGTWRGSHLSDVMSNTQASPKERRIIVPHKTVVGGVEYGVEGGVWSGGCMEWIVVW